MYNQVVRQAGVVGCACALLAGCASAGAGPIINRYGPVDNTATTGAALRFKTSADLAVKAGSTTELRRAMLDDGFALISASCSDFFESSGRRQSWVITSKDAINVLSTLATGAVALRNGSDDTVAAIAFGSSAAYAGLDLYTRNYLFGVENIDAVRELTMRAIDTHQTAVAAKGPETYTEVLQALLDDQNYCAPRKIASQVREAIKGGKLDPYSSSNGEGSVAAQGDAQVMRQIGRLLGLPGPLSSDQAGALWWLVKGAAQASEYPKIQARLADLPTDLGPFDSNKALKGQWDLHDRVQTELNLLSASGRKKLEDWLTALRASTPPPGVDAAPGGLGPPAAPDLTADEGGIVSSPSKRVEVKVRDQNR